jgi:uncharacterized membrane protein SpoIIM required for sporulation
MPSSDRFINERRGAWQRLEDLLGMLDRSSLRRLNRTWRFTALAFAAYALFAALAFAATTRDPEFSALAGIPPQAREYILEQKPRWWERANDANQLAATYIGTNNIRVTFNAFALGATFGIGTLFYMAMNGLSHAATVALTFRAGYGGEMLTFMAAHGVIELTCIFIAGGGGILFGTAVLFPGDRPRFDNLRLRGRESAQLIAGCVPLLAVAGTIEGFISPAPIPAGIKFAVAAATGVALYAYLLLAGRGAD